MTKERLILTKGGKLDFFTFFTNHHQMIQNWSKSSNSGFLKVTLKYGLKLKLGKTVFGHSAVCC